MSLEFVDLKSDSLRELGKFTKDIIDNSPEEAIIAAAEEINDIAKAELDVTREMIKLNSLGLVDKVGVEHLTYAIEKVGNIETAEEGISDVIKGFFNAIVKFVKAIFGFIKKIIDFFVNLIKKLFGGSSSSSGGGGGSSVSSTVAEIKKTEKPKTITLGKIKLKNNKEIELKIKEEDLIAGIFKTIKEFNFKSLDIKNNANLNKIKNTIEENVEFKNITSEIGEELAKMHLDKEYNNDETVINMAEIKIQDFISKKAAEFLSKLIKESNDLLNNIEENKLKLMEEIAKIIIDISNKNNIKTTNGVEKITVALFKDLHEFRRFTVVAITLVTWLDFASFAINEIYKISNENGDETVINRLEDNETFNMLIEKLENELKDRLTNNLEKSNIETALKKVDSSINNWEKDLKQLSKQLYEDLKNLIDTTNIKNLVFMTDSKFGDYTIKNDSPIKIRLDSKSNIPNLPGIDYKILDTENSKLHHYYCLYLKNLKFAKNTTEKIDINIGFEFASFYGYEFKTTKELNEGTMNDLNTDLGNLFNNNYLNYMFTYDVKSSQNNTATIEFDKNVVDTIVKLLKQFNLKSLEYKNIANIKQNIGNLASELSSIKSKINTAEEIISNITNNIEGKLGQNTNVGKFLGAVIRTYGNFLKDALISYITILNPIVGIFNKKEQKNKKSK